MISTFPTWNSSMKLKSSIPSTDDDVDKSVVGIDFHLQLLSSLLVPVDEAKPHGGGVGVEKLKLKNNILLTCCLLSFINKDLVFVVQPNSHY